MEKRIQIILLENGPIEDRDFTDGKAREYLEKLKKNGAKTVNSIQELVNFINNLEIENNNKIN